MIVARGNQKGGAGETAFALHLGGQTARQSKRITLLDADQQGSALVSLEQRAGKPQERPFAVIGLTQATLRREAPEHALLAHHIIVDGSPLVAALPRSAALAGALAPVPMQPALLDSQASTGVSGRVAETRVFRSAHFAHVSLRPWPTGSPIARATPQGLVDDDPRFRLSLAHGLPSPKRRGSSSSSSAPNSVATASQHASLRRSPRDRKACSATKWKRDRGFAASPRDAEAGAAGIRNRGREHLNPARRGQPAGAPQLHQDHSLRAQPDRRRRGLCEQLAPEFPPSNGGPFMRPEPSAGCAPERDAGPTLTRVELTWFEGRIEHWIRFGHKTGETILDRRRRVLRFAPSSVFAFVHWASNDFGTIISRIDIVQAVDHGAPYQALPFVRPGGDILLRISGWPKVERVLQAIDAVEAIGFDPAEAAPDHWRCLHNRLVAGEPPRPYSREQHRAWLLRRRLTP